MFVCGDQRRKKNFRNIYASGLTSVTALAFEMFVLNINIKIELNDDKQTTKTYFVLRPVSAL